MKKNKELFLASSSFYTGKALLLNRLLVDTVHDLESRSDDTILDAQTIQSLLTMIQELLFSTLPWCGVSIQEALSSSSSSLVRTIVSATSLVYWQGPVETRSQLHRLLVKWLAPVVVHKELHPVTRENVISLVQFHVLHMAHAPISPQGGKWSKRFASFR